MGRPKEELKLWDNWQQDIIDLYKEGGSDVEVKAMIHEYRGSFSNDLWDRWMIEEPNFSETIKTGKVLSEAYFHRLGRKNLYEKDFSYTGWYMQMKNRYGWKDNNAVDHTTKGDKIETPNIIVNTPDVAKAFEELKQMFEDETDNDV